MSRIDKPGGMLIVPFNSLRAAGNLEAQWKRDALRSWDLLVAAWREAEATGVMPPDYYTLLSWCALFGFASPQAVSYGGAA